MKYVEFEAFDCDNHYYEALDAFTRFLEPSLQSRAMQWVELNGRTRLLVGGKVNRFIPNPTFDPVSKPGQLDDYFRGRKPSGEDVGVLFGELDPISERPAYRDRDARLRLMDEQGLGGAIFLPTLGVGMEQALIHDPPALIAAFRAFNRWLDDDWGFAYRERIFAAPILTFADPEELVREIEWGLGRDARFFVVVPGPVVTPSGSRSPADPVYDPAWARLAESGVTLALHGGDSRYTQYLKDWGETPGLESFRPNRFGAVASWNHTQDYFANLLVHGLYHRFPNLRMASIETGSDWVFHLFDKLEKVYRQTPGAFPEDPRDTFRRHVWVSPYYEDDLAALRDLLGAERVLMGSDFPHAEGLAEPTAYIRDLERAGYAATDARLVMRENGLALSQRRPA